MKISRIQFFSFRKIYFLATILLLCSNTANLQAQSYDFETCWGIQNPPNACQGKGSEEMGVEYEFPQVLNCNADNLPSAAKITPSDAGIVLGVTSSGDLSGSKPKVCIKWLKPGYNEVKVFYHCGLGYLETRTKTVYVSLSGVNYANFTLSNVSNCPSPFSSFTVSRTTTSSGPVKKNRVLLYALDANGNFSGSPVFDTNWRNGDFISETFNYGNGGINFVPGVHYKVQFQTQSACGTHVVTSSTIISGQDYAEPVPDFTVNGSSTFPVDLFNCDNSPMIMNDATLINGCNPGIGHAKIEIEQASDCNSGITGTKLFQYVNYSSSYNLRTLFPGYASTPGLYRVTYSVSGVNGLITSPTYCIRINSLDPSNAEFLLKAPNNGMPLSRTTTDPDATNQMLGGLTAGLYLTNTTSLVNSLDYYIVEIWLTSAGLNTQKILDTGHICLDDDPNTSDCIDYPLGFDFNPKTNGYFFNLSQSEKSINRYRVRLTVHNQCGESFQESYFRIDPSCTFCLAGQDGDQGMISDHPEAVARELNKQKTPEASIQVLPNPTTGKLRILATLQGMGLAEFNLFDQNAREVAGFQRDMDTNSYNLNEEMNVESLPAGLYWWRLIANGQLWTGQIIKK